MKIDRIDPLLPAPSAARPVRGAAAEPSASPPLTARIGAALASPEAAGALRVLVEEVRTELQALLGPSRPLPPARPEPLDADAAVAVLLRYLRTAARVPPAAGVAEPEQVRQAVDAGLTRAKALLAASARVPPSVIATVEQVAARVRAAEQALVPRPPVAPAAEALSRGIVREVVATLSERIGMLPAAATSARPPQGPQEALAQLTRLFQSVAEDSVLAVRASPRVVEFALRDATRRALEAQPREARPDPALQRLSADLLALALRRAAAPAAAWPSPRAPAAAMGLMIAELRQALAEPGAEAPSAPPQVRDAGRALGAMAAAAAAALGRLPQTQVVALRSVLETAADQALRRSLLQLEAGDGQAPARTTLEQLHAAFRGLLAAADSAATGRGLDARGWVGLLARAGETMLEGGAPPFRFDLPVGRSGAARRRLARGSDGESIEAIVSSDPAPEDDAGGDGPIGPPLWPRPPAT